MTSGVPSENEGWRLETRTCGADVSTCYEQGGGEVVPKKKLWIGMDLAKLWRVAVMIHLRISCRASNFIKNVTIFHT